MPAARAASTTRAIAGTAAVAPGTESLPSGCTKSTCVSTSQRTRAATGTRVAATARRLSLGDELEPRVRPAAAADLRRRLAIRHHDVAGEVVRAADEGGADAVGVDGD